MGSVRRATVWLVAALLPLDLMMPLRAGLAADLPPYMAPIAGTTTTTPAEVANQNVLALNNAMFDLYSNSSTIFQRNLLAQHPVILALFSGAGGRFILYRPGQPPLEAPPVPLVYQLLKSSGHSTMALTEVVLPYLENPSNKSWRAPLLAYRSRMQSALDTLDAADMPAEWRPTLHTILQNNVAFMDECLKNDVITLAAMQAFAAKQSPELKKVISWAAQTQVAHWMDVVGEWKKMLGDDWDKTYAASNTIYVTRQNNILFSVLAQYFGPEAINDRLLLIETTSFTTTPNDMLESVMRIVSDRSVGAIFFGNDRLMDYELMGGDARNAIIAETNRRGMKAFLPPAVPFGSHQWPMLITPGSGATSLNDME
ncbi:hypothetical protein [Methylovirgula sp. 4M-Z18]|uniref:hypothetical protein n=1 Tax=Methylovirgula sp. 4M-Z18 TaxID=2293567 RepID=UPI0018F676CF|nr:hypothetical protein [Methylovirgula sp. 4M-Z18]